MVLIFTSMVIAQEKKEEEEIIEDNSYFLEEAYNQEVRVVQHISSRLINKEGSTFLFTQEWPAFGVTHQLSYTIPYITPLSGVKAGVGDILLNYRYQLLEHDDFVACAPRFSLILPTGDDKNGFGMGTLGFQINVAASKRLSKCLVTHINAGTTFFPGVKYLDASNVEQKEAVKSYDVGASLIWLTQSCFNVMLEWLTNIYADRANEKGYSETYLSPGVRFALNFDKINLQVVPGLAVPFYFSQGQHNVQLFLYLSFEHAY
jgi:hypothetical protein